MSNRYEGLGVVNYLEEVENETRGAKKILNLLAGVIGILFVVIVFAGFGIYSWSLWNTKPQRPSRIQQPKPIEFKVEPPRTPSLTTAPVLHHSLPVYSIQENVLAAQTLPDLVELASTIQGGGTPPMKKVTTLRPGSNLRMLQKGKINSLGYAAVRLETSDGKTFGPLYIFDGYLEPNAGVLQIVSNRDPPGIKR